MVTSGPKSPRNLTTTRHRICAGPALSLLFKANLLRFRAISSDEGVRRPSPAGTGTGGKGVRGEGHKRALRRFRRVSPARD
jgi:hypothetical protein